MTQSHEHTWFIVHHDDAPWSGVPGHAYVDLAQRAGDGSFTQYGIAVDVFEPGNGACYHRELHDDETFVVLDGEFDLVIEGELHRIHAGELVHCPAGTAHVFVGAGDRTASIVSARAATSPTAAPGASTCPSRSPSSSDAASASSRATRRSPTRDARPTPRSRLRSPSASTARRARPHPSGVARPRHG